MKSRALLLAALSVVATPVHAGLFDDDVARQQVQQLSARVASLEDAAKQQQDANAQRLLELQSQIDALNAEIRTLRGQGEELVNGLQNGEKRQKDFYLDLDTRLRKLEPPESGGASSQPGAAPNGNDMAAGNRAYEIAHNLFSAGKYQDAIVALQNFQQKYPDSVYVPNAIYEQGDAYYALDDCNNALIAYRAVASQYEYNPKAPDAMLSVATCQQKLKDAGGAKKTLKALIAKYPRSDAAQEAKKRLAESR
jgi:tol-pal system protein YbgF